MAYRFDSNMAVGSDDYNAARSCEINIAKGFIRSLDNGKRFYRKNYPEMLERRVCALDDSSIYVAGIDIFHHFWDHIGAGGWISEDDCPDWTGDLWLRAMLRCHMKFSFNTFNIGDECFYYEGDQ